MSEIIISIVVGLIAGGGLGWALFAYSQRIIKKIAQEEAAEVIEKAKAEAELIYLDQKEREQEIENELWSRVEKDQQRQEERIEELQANNAEIAKKQAQIIEQKWTQIKQQEATVNEYASRVQKQNSHYDQKKQSLQSTKEQIVQRLTEKHQLNKHDLKESLHHEVLKETEIRAAKLAQSIEEHAKEEAENIAKKYLDTAIDRFQRPYCDERSISLVAFNSEEDKKQFAANPANLKAVLDVSGCEIFINPESLLIGVIGYDPVRRELVRRVLEKVVRDRRNFNPQSILRLGEACKKELFKNIKNDGEAVAKELGQHDLHPEIKQMMGSLRYRYSFTQNQYFHCAEVGWLAGLLASELKNENLKKCRRSGLLHDLGKTMDHAMDGGHAVIGADFIQARNESPDVVHAVRAHHFDEQPSTNMAFIVIAADAVSGARPGARRSTIESYAQKLTELETISRSFKGVEDAFVLSGGREVRVLVNSKEISDAKAMELSRQIAEKIELEANYPGQIKVVVVRSTFIAETINTKI